MSSPAVPFCRTACTRNRHERSRPTAADPTPVSNARTSSASGCDAHRPLSDRPSRIGCRARQAPRSGTASGSGSRLPTGGERGTALVAMDDAAASRHEAAAARTDGRAVAGHQSSQPAGCRFRAIKPCRTRRSASEFARRPSSVCSPTARRCGSASPCACWCGAADLERGKAGGDRPRRKRVPHRWAHRLSSCRRPTGTFCRTRQTGHGWRSTLTSAAPRRRSGEPHGDAGSDVSGPFPDPLRDRLSPLNDESPGLAGLSYIGAPRFELGTLSPPGVQGVQSRAWECTESACLQGFRGCRFPLSALVPSGLATTGRPRRPRVGL